MTSEMAFECLFVSSDPSVFRVVSRIIRDLSISINICLNSEKAIEFLEKGSTDLVVIDWMGDDSSELLRRVWQRRIWRKPTVLAVASAECSLPGVDVVLKKPVTLEASRVCLRAAYSRMLVEHRRHARYALLLPVVATRDDGERVPLTAVDIGDGGVGFTSTKRLAVGDVLSFRLHLPGTAREILVYVRVAWTRDYARFGSEFLRIPPVDLIILHDWLKQRQRVKKPLDGVC